MLMSKCGFCGGLSWEIHEESPRGAALKVNFIRCALCKVPVGVLPFMDHSSQISWIVKTLQDMQR